jgi:hypothetical protein
MAGDWIKMRVELSTHPKIVRIGAQVGSNRATVVGACFLIWAMADQHTEDGHMSTMTLDDVDAFVGVKGLGVAMKAVGWIEETPEGLQLPKYERHNGRTAKARLTSAQRAKSSRSRDRAQSSPERTETVRDERTKSASRIRMREEEEVRECASAHSCSISADATSSDQPSRETIPSAKVEVIYRAYPRKVGKKKAIETIRKAIKDIAARGKIPVDDAADWLHERVVAFARSPAGQAGEFTPHPSTWFQQGRYDDDDRDWQIERGGGNGRADNGDGKPAVNHGASWDEWG